MRLALLPCMTTRQYVGAESDLKCYRDLMMTARELGIDAFGNYVLFEDIADQLVAAPNERFFCTERFASVYELHSTMPRGFVELFHPIDGRYPAELVMTSRSVLASFIKRGLWHRMHQRPQIPVFIFEGHVETSQETGAGCHAQLVDEELFLRSVGYATCSTFFSTERQKKGAIKEALRWLSSESASRIEKNSWVVPHPIRCDEIDEAVKNTPKRDKFTVGWFGRFNATKRWDFVADTLRQYFSLGKPIDLCAVAPLHGANADLGDWPEFTKYIDLPRKDYLKMLAQTHVALNASSEEGFCITVHEQLYAGQVVLLPRRDWVQAILGPHWDSYPWLYSGRDEAIAKLEMVRKDYPAARESIEPVRQFVRAKADAKATVKFMLDRFQDAIDESKRHFTMSDKAAELIRRGAVAAGKIARFSKIKQLIKEYAIQPGIIFNRNAPMGTFPGGLSVYWKLKEMGWKDTGEADPMMVASEAGVVIEPVQNAPVVGV